MLSVFSINTCLNSCSFTSFEQNDTAMSVLVCLLRNAASHVQESLRRPSTKEKFFSFLFELYFFFWARWQITAEKMRRLFSPYLSARSNDSLRHFRVISYSGFYIMYSVYFLTNHKLHTNEMYYIFFLLFIIQPLHTFQPLQGHFQGARSLHLFYIHCCLVYYVIYHK